MNIKIFRAFSALLTMFLSGLFLLSRADAAYKSGTGSTAAARIANFDVVSSEPVLKSEDSVLDCNLSGDNVVYEFEVENRSETAVSYETDFSGISDNVLSETVHGSGSLSPGEKETVRVTFRVKDEGDRAQQTDLSGFKGTVKVLQEEVTP